MTVRRGKGRPSQDKVMRPYTLDRMITAFIDRLPDGERSRFVNSILVQGVALEKLSGKYYDYILMRPDGSVFYIGKGTGNRINEHETQARTGVQSPKCDVIRKIWDEGGQVIKQKIAFFEKEEDAYALEILLISFFGRENLTNQRDGGAGGSRTREGKVEIDYERISMGVPPDMLEVIRQRAKTNDRSVNKEVIGMLRALLQQEQQAS